MNLICPLCNGKNHTLYHEDQQRPYYQCATCLLVFVPPSFHLPPAEEKARYDHHQNDSESIGYRTFLNRLMTPMANALTLGATGLDFGSGPGPTLSLLFKEAGFSCVNYDPFYSNNPALLSNKYDFVSCSEVIEHCYHPAQVFEQMLTLLNPGGVLGIMTQLLPDKAAFPKWYYIIDTTHVCFFSCETLEWMAQTYNLRVMFCENSVTLFFV